MDMLFGSSDLRICPNCAQEFYPGECRIVSQIQQGKVLKAAPTTWLERQRARRYPEPLVGDLYLKELACRECPHCNYLLPYNIESVEAKSIVVVGDTYSGKSHFIAALIRQIQDGLIQNPNHSTRFVCLTPKVLEKYTQNYLNALFKKKEVLLGTQPAAPATPIEPLIYELIVKKSPAHPAKKTNLILYDASGEDYANADRLVQYTHYVLNASGMIFLADPVSMPDILDRLPLHLQNQPVTGRRASDVLNSTIQLLERKRGLEPGSAFMQMPIAITLSKSDLLKYLRGINDPYSFLSNPKNDYTSGVDLRDLEKVDGEVRQLLAEFGDRTLLEATRTLNAQFFAASATGHAPKADDTYPAVEPRRCLDPVLWLLYQLQVIDGQ
jgi:hypothetical protein